jgi:nucleoid DNA-binding protein
MPLNATRARTVSISEFLPEIALSVELPEYKVKKALKAVMVKMAVELAAGKAVRFYTFGTFDVKPQAARNFKNIKTGLISVRPAINRVRLKQGVTLRDAVNS